MKFCFFVLSSLTLTLTLPFFFHFCFPLGVKRNDICSQCTNVLLLQQNVKSWQLGVFHHTRQWPPCLWIDGFCISNSCSNRISTECFKSEPKFFEQNRRKTVDFSRCIPCLSIFLSLSLFLSFTCTHFVARNSFKKHLKKNKIK